MTNTDLPHTAANRPTDDLPGAASESRAQTVSECPSRRCSRSSRRPHRVDEAQASPRRSRGPASMNVRAAERELMALFSSYADISPDHPRS